MAEETPIMKLIARYRELRDAKQKIAQAAKDKIAKVDGVLDKIEATLLEEFDNLGVDSMKTPAGTAYRQSRTSATVADWDQLLDFVLQNKNYHFLERRVSKDAVAQFKAENDDLPPGVNWREEYVINVRAN